MMRLGIMIYDAFDKSNTIKLNNSANGYISNY